MSILNEIIATKRIEVSRLNRDSLLEAALEITRPTISLSRALINSQSGIIAEFKRRSPSKGFINELADVAAVVEGYASSGAAAISVLTDSKYFAGSEVDLRKAREATPRTPILRKEFIIDPCQICEARIWGADAILLIASALDPYQTQNLAQFAHQLGLEVLLEIHNSDELSHLNEHIDVVGVNNRDLSTFTTDTNISIRLSEMIPAHMIKISESGISSPQTICELRSVGYRGFLMGENFMKESSPAQALSQFISTL